jgi:hypothetical protein
MKSNGGEGVKMIYHPPYLLDFPSADFFFLKSELVDLLLSQDSFKKSLEGVVRTIAKDPASNAIRRWTEGC